MYYLTPFSYLLEGFLGAAVHDVPVVCESSEFARFSPPPGQTCQQYTQAFIQQAGGYVQEQAGICEFCQYANGDEFVSCLTEYPFGSLFTNDREQAASFNVFYSNIWLDYGVFFVSYAS